MSTVKTKQRKSRKKVPGFNGNAFNKPFLDHAKQLVDDIFPEVVFLALQAKYGVGIISAALLAPELKAQVQNAMLPLRRKLEIKAFSSSFEAFLGVHNEPSIKDFLQYRAAVGWGKKGGRRINQRAPHLLWLENKMRQHENNNPVLAKLTARQHYQELVDIGYVDVDPDDHSLQFIDSLKDEFSRDGQDNVPPLTMATVTRALTKIRKT